jgi:DNA-binding MarR family transcriptional regulator
MPVLHTTPDDLVKLRFAHRPLLEIPLSYRVLINPQFQAPHRAWVEDARRALYGVDLPYISALITEDGYIPDFITPTPLTSGVNIDEDISALLDTPDDLIRRNIQELMANTGESETRLFFISYPHEALHHLVDEMRLYWQHTLAQSWSRMAGVIEGDILYRGKQLALDGPDSLFGDLHPTIAYRQNQIWLGECCHHAHCPSEVNLEGVGVQLVPTIFTGCGCVVHVTPKRRAMILYKARGAGLHYRDSRAAQPLEQALGTARARVLQTLTTPATTGEVAHKTRSTAGTASQHLSRLTKAGLVEPHRSGIRVYSHLTERGRELIALFERID